MDVLSVDKQDQTMPWATFSLMISHMSDQTPRFQWTNAKYRKLLIRRLRKPAGTLMINAAAGKTQGCPTRATAERAPETIEATHLLVRVSPIPLLRPNKTNPRKRLSNPKAKARSLHTWIPTPVG